MFSVQTDIKKNMHQKYLCIYRLGDILFLPLYDEKLAGNYTHLKNTIMNHDVVKYNICYYTVHIFYYMKVIRQFGCFSENIADKGDNPVNTPNM